MEKSSEDILKEKARKHLFNTPVKDFPVVFEMYARAFNLHSNPGERIEQLHGIHEIIRSTPDSQMAYQKMCSWLSGLESKVVHQGGQPRSEPVQQHQ